MQPASSSARPARSRCRRRVRALAGRATPPRDPIGDAATAPLSCAAIYVPSPIVADPAQSRWRASISEALHLAASGAGHRRIARELDRPARAFAAGREHTPPPRDLRERPRMADAGPGTGRPRGRRRAPRRGRGDRACGQCVGAVPFSASRSLIPSSMMSVSPDVDREGARRRMFQPCSLWAEVRRSALVEMRSQTLLIQDTGSS